MLIQKSVANSLHVQPQGKAFLGIPLALVGLKIFAVFLLHHKV